jgi:hypothetical protein
MVPFLAHNRIPPGARATYTPFQLEKVTADPARKSHRSTSREKHPNRASARFVG